MKPWVQAWTLATISGLSLPIGAILGLLFTPVSDEVCAAWMALGAGALLFAVTVELYGHSLRELELGRAGLFELLATVVGALLGAFIYLAVNRWLEHLMMDEKVEDMERREPSSANEHTPLCATRGTPQPPTPTLQRGKESNWSVSSALAEERRRWEQASVSAGARSLRDDSFSRMSSISGGPTVSDELSSIKSRGRDRVINRIQLSRQNSFPQSRKSTPLSSLTQVDPEMAYAGKRVAFALFLGILVDGVPEGILMGFLAAEGHLSTVLVISLLVANFPEAFSSASLMRQGGVPRAQIVCMWGGLCLMVGALAGGACFLLLFFFPTYPDGADLPHLLIIAVAVIEGITGGAMIACIATVMLPEAFQRAGKEGSLLISSGFLCTAGFLVAVVMKALEHHYENTRGNTPDIYGHTFLLLGQLT
jgi:zinc transporter ZupT